MTQNIRGLLIYGLIGGPPPYGLGYSLGLDVLRGKLQAAGIHASTHVEGVVIPHSNVRRIVRYAEEGVRNGSRLLLLGHSMGADAAVKVATRLAWREIAVDLLIGFDPTKFACPRVPPNVRRALCFYQNELGDFLGGGKFRPANDFSGELVNERVPYRHKKMDDAPALHERVLDEARKVVGP